MTTTRTINEVRVYWDSQDPTNEGWAYRVDYSDGHRESGSLSDYVDLPMLTDSAALSDAVVEVAWQHDLQIDDHGAIACEPNIDGGFAVWTAGE